MEFTSQDDIRAARDEVFAILSDVSAIEQQAMRRGVDIGRTTAHQSPAVGMGWHVTFRFRGRKRGSDITLSDFTPPSRMVFDGKTGGLDTVFAIDLEDLAPGMTRLRTTATLVPKTLSARLLVQSLKLAKARMSRTYGVRMAQISREIEERAVRRRGTGA